jgi:hypothetical protein
VQPEDLLCSRRENEPSPSPGVEHGAPGVGSAEVHQALYPVVQAKDDHVIVGRERWYLNEVACRKAATTKRDM